MAALSQVNRHQCRGTGADLGTNPDEFQSDVVFGKRTHCEFSRDGMAQKILNRKGNESWTWVFLPHTGCTGIQQASPPVSTQNTVSGHFLSPPLPFAWSVNPALWDPCVGGKADGRHKGPNACSADWSWLGNDYLLVGMRRGWEENSSLILK